MSQPERPVVAPEPPDGKPVNPIIAFFVKRSVFSTAVFLAMVLFGLITGSRVGVDLLPRFEIPVVAVTTAYPGAGPEEVEQQVSCLLYHRGCGLHPVGPRPDRLALG
jgi:HAE1 family hydrophobic/amphiphilic exporter-1